MVNSISEKELQALQFIRNSLLHHYHSPSIREIMTHLGYTSSNSAAFVVNKLIEKGYLRRREKGAFQIMGMPSQNQSSATVRVPLLGTVPCGTPMFAEENIEGWVSLSQSWVQPHYNYFLLRAIGDSMNRRGIDEGNLLLIREQNSANNGDMVVALIDDEATVKVYEQKSDRVVLRPDSTNNDHQPIILKNDFTIQGVVTEVLPNI